MRRRRRRPYIFQKGAFCTSGRRLTITASNLCKRELRLPRTRPTEFLPFCMRMAGSSIDTPRRLEHHTKSHGCLFPRGSGHLGRGHRPIVPRPSSRTEQNALCVRGTSSSRFPMGLRRCRLTFWASPACRRAASADRRRVRRLSLQASHPACAGKARPVKGRADAGYAFVRRSRRGRAVRLPSERPAPESAATPLPASNPCNREFRLPRTRQLEVGPSSHADGRICYGHAAKARLAYQRDQRPSLIHIRASLER